MKLDVEGAEYLALEQALDDGFLLNNVKQLILEWHIRPAVLRYNRLALRKILEVYIRLQDSGFKMYFNGKYHSRYLKYAFLPFTAHVNIHLAEK